MSIERGSEPDFLIAEYTLGLVDANETARVHELLANDPQAITTALKWEGLFLTLTDQLDPVEPAPHILQRVQATLGHEITLIKRPSIWPRIAKKIWSITLGGVWFWRFVSAVLAIVAITYAIKPNLAVMDQPPPVQVAILQAPGQTSTPGVIVTLDAKHNLVLNPKVHIDVPANAAVQLWTHNERAPEPRSLGVFKPNETVVVPVAVLGKIDPNQLFEMTLEQAGGSSTGTPSGPILFIGRLITLPAMPLDADKTGS